MELTLSWLKEHKACDESQDLFIKKYGKEGSVSIKEIIENLRKFGLPSWEGWLMAQEVPLTEAMIKEGADMRICEDYPVRKAAALGNLEMVKYLVGHGADIHALRDDAIECAVKNEHLPVVRYMVEEIKIDTSTDSFIVNAAKVYNSQKVIEYLQSLAK